MGGISLDDKYLLEEGRVFISGLQALVRLPIVQMRRDKAAGINTGAYISGYRGSPLGSYDIQLARAKPFLDSHGVVARPGVNEDLAASAVWGTQQLHLSPGAKKEGVVGIWYGKGPGVDRSGDVFKHGNAAGSSAKGGVLCFAGDDHSCKSSTIPHQSDHAFMSALMPVLYPSSVHEFVEMGLFGVAMSRYSGCWVGMKFVSDTVESSAVVDLKNERRIFCEPDDFELPPGGVNLRWPDPPLVQDERLQEIKGYAAQAFARANKADGIAMDSLRPRLGIVASGKAFEDARQALRFLGVDGKNADAVGVRLYKVRMPWPLEPEGVRAFAQGLEEVLVIEDRREMIENQIKQVLFNWRANMRPRIVGKFDENDKPFFSHSAVVTPEAAARGIAKRLLLLDFDESLKKQVREKSESLARREKEERERKARPLRVPYYCSGCPHNISTRVPEGSSAMAGIGCHYMAMWMERRTQTFSQMGGEGVAWAGASPFTSEKHRFVNLGDGTYFHSGILAVRQAVAAGINITYKVLYNGAVAMTGGQPLDGDLSPERLTWQLHNEGVSPVWFVSERPEDFDAKNMAPGAVIKHRDEMENVMREAREQKGCSAIVYEQMCAAERRRKRKRGELPDPPRRAFIHPEVCEGCGDCSEQSNCVSIEPLDTPFGVKRRINQSSCNKDFSCLKGFCPSFVTIEGGDLRKPAPPKLPPDDANNFPPPVLPKPGRDGWNIVVAGVGGTGVLTAGALLGTAAQMAGMDCMVMDMAGLAQKGGKVLGQIRFGSAPETVTSPQIIAGGADVLLAADMLAAAAPDATKLCDRARTRAAVNTRLLPTADFVLRGDSGFGEDDAREWINGAVCEADFYNFTEAAEEAAGDAIAANIAMLGFASQKGMLPPPPSAIVDAIKLNGVAVKENIAAFAHGRKMALEKPPQQSRPPSPSAMTLPELIAHRRAHLVAYQDESLAQKYEAAVEKTAAAAKEKGLGATLARAVAENYAKVLAPKDEYEIARLFSEPSFYEELERRFAGGKIVFHLAPPFLPGRDASGRPRKYAFGPWMRGVFRFLQTMKSRRGTALDVFSRTPERREERALIGEYEQLMQRVLPDLRKNNEERALALLNFPAEIRGYGPVKTAAIKKARKKKESLLRSWENPPPGEA